MKSAKDIRHIQKIFDLPELKDAPRLAVMFSALGDPNRFRIFKLLSLDRDVCVTDIAKIFGMSVPAVSQHLKILEQAELIKPRRNGQMICYRVPRNDREIDSVVRLMGVKKVGKR